MAIAALYFHFKNPHRTLRAGKFSLTCLIVATLLMAALGTYQVGSEVMRLFAGARRPAITETTPIEPGGATGRYFFAPRKMSSRSFCRSGTASNKLAVVPTIKTTNSEKMPYHRLATSVSRQR